MIIFDVNIQTWISLLHDISQEHFLQGYIRAFQNIPHTDMSLIVQLFHGTRGAQKLAFCKIWVLNSIELTF